MTEECRGQQSQYHTYFFFGEEKELNSIFLFIFLIVAYSMLAVKQDDFSDVPLPSTLPGVQDVTNEHKKKQ